MHELSTGAVADILNTTEPRLGELVRRGHIVPPPRVVVGRRAWAREQALQAAAALGVLTPELEARIERATAGPEEARRG